MASWGGDSPQRSGSFAQAASVNLAASERAFRTWINHVISDFSDFQSTAPIWESIGDGYGLAYLAEGLLGRQGQIAKQLKPNPQFRIQVGF
jgi:hypothetical protein